MPITSASQAWAILVRHARDDIESLRLLELCLDTHRVSSLVSVLQNENKGTLVVDFSRQKLALETLDHLLHFAYARKCMEFINRMPYSISANRNEGRSVLALRAPRGANILHSSPSPSNSLPDEQRFNVCLSVHKEWDRMKRFSESYRQGVLRSCTGAMIRDVVVVGSGVAMHALRFVYDALLQDPKGNQAASLSMQRRTFGGSSDPPHRRLRLISSIDTSTALKALQDLDINNSCDNSSLTGQEETGLASRLLKHWLLQQLSSVSRKTESIFSKHMLLVTGNERLYQSSRSESVFLLPPIARNSEPFCVTTSMTLLPLSIIFGWPLVEDEFLGGAHAMDTHVMESNPRHNIPLLLALVDLWNDAFLSQASGRIIQPFSENFIGYGDFVAALESQVCSGGGIDISMTSSRNTKDASCGWVINDRGDVYDRCLFQSKDPTQAEMLLTLDPTVYQRQTKMMKIDDIISHHDALLCSLLGQADELALNHNRPSTLMLVGHLDAFMCGQLIALAEHRTLLKAQLWNMNSTTVLTSTSNINIPSVISPSSIISSLSIIKGGASLRTVRADGLREELGKLVKNADLPGAEDDEYSPEGVNLSTATLLNNYAGRTRRIRLNNVGGD
eukprot:CAMPEP_0178910598 /NCGR_PEP_ID=MMETSP0786-20121207/9185_1 /TAXON_ID=186022 /ORGANISM="Thalassionema frauenfeldii, Strain CCMP 1798" /LENGTH=618 /DNA_ID=CAMNT_0020582865 /DNA_START=32 /DNA_END=1889 /DNA_ORIENTATION=-